MKLRVIHIARKPLSESSVAQNVLRHGTGVLNIERSRIGCNDHPGVHKREGDIYSPTLKGKPKTEDSGIYHTPSGRWPANLILQHKPGCPRGGVKIMGSGNLKIKTTDTDHLEGGVHGGYRRPGRSSYTTNISGQVRAYGIEAVENWTCEPGRSGVKGNGWGMTHTGAEYDDSGGASRFFKQVQ
jgi:site-specific DNA-methyltransferase (adenine-specific)